MSAEWLIALAGLLAPGDEAITSSLRQLDVSPSAFLDARPTTRERLWATSAPERDPSLPWLALVDLLIDGGHAAELDWKIDPGELGFALSTVLDRAGVDGATREAIEGIDREETLTVLHLRDAAALLAHADTILAVMDIDSDSYIVLLLPRDRFSPATQIADAHGFKLRDIRRYDPNEYHEGD